MPSVVTALSLHDALPISHPRDDDERHVQRRDRPVGCPSSRLGQGLAYGGLSLPALHPGHAGIQDDRRPRDRKSTRLNSSHVAISYAVFCLKKKKQTDEVT